jgi:hypothetical protein
MKGGISVDVPGVGISGKVSMSAQQSPFVDGHFLQQSSVRSASGSKQTRIGNAASGTIIPKQMSSNVAMNFFKTRSSYWF